MAVWVGTSVAFYPVGGGTPRVLCPYCGTAGDENRGVTPPLVRWSHDGKFLYLHAVTTRQTYVVPLRDGELLPQLAPDGYSEIRDAATALGAHPLADLRAYASDDPSMYVFPRVSAHRNIYRVSLN